MKNLATLQGIFREVFDDDTLVISPTTGAQEIRDWDSIAHVKLILAMESEFDIRFMSEEVSKLKTVGDFLAKIERYQAG